MDGVRAIHAQLATELAARGFGAFAHADQAVSGALASVAGAGRS
ncbi:hypothetical protein [Actinoplanes sp. NPDC020271]